MTHPLFSTMCDVHWVLSWVTAITKRRWMWVNELVAQKKGRSVWQIPLFMKPGHVVLWAREGDSILTLLLKFLWISYSLLLHPQLLIQAQAFVWSSDERDWKNDWGQNKWRFFWKVFFGGVGHHCTEWCCWHSQGAKWGMTSTLVVRPGNHSTSVWMLGVNFFWGPKSMLWMTKSAISNRFSAFHLWSMISVSH